MISASSHEVANTERRHFDLDAHFERNGAWAGVGPLVEIAYLRLLEVGNPAIVEEHDYELYLALPRYRHKIRPKYLCLTDTAVGTEQTRFYPLERAYRLVHGLVGLVLHDEQDPITAPGTIGTALRPCATPVDARHRRAGATWHPTRDRCRHRD